MLSHGTSFRVIKSLRADATLSYAKVLQKKTGTGTSPIPVSFYPRPDFRSLSLDPYRFRGSAV